MYYISTHPLPFKFVLKLLCVSLSPYLTASHCIKGPDIFPQSKSVTFLVLHFTCSSNFMVYFNQILHLSSYINLSLYQVVLISNLRCNLMFCTNLCSKADYCVQPTISQELPVCCATFSHISPFSQCFLLL